METSALEVSKNTFGSLVSHCALSVVFFIGETRLIKSLSSCIWALRNCQYCVRRVVSPSIICFCSIPVSPFGVSSIIYSLKRSCVMAYTVSALPA